MRNLSATWLTLLFGPAVLLQLGTIRSSLRLSLTALQYFDGREENSAATTPSSNTASTSIKKKPKPPKWKDRLETMERLKRVMQINNTVELLQKMQITKNDIPLWSDIDELYGPEFPLVLGMERCRDYRNATPSLRNRWVAPAGLFHTGTNLMGKLLSSVCTGLRPRAQVPYGKHHPINSVLEDEFIIPKPEYQKVKNFSRILPIVMVRNPLDWMQSECKEMFGVTLDKKLTLKQRRRGLPCPHLNTSIDVKFYRPHRYKSMLHLWMEWYLQYLEYEGPRLLVRLEDMVYHPEETMEKICDCAGGSFNYSHHVMSERRGGIGRAKDGNYRFKAWKRHSRVNIESHLGKSRSNMQLFRSLASTDDMQTLLDAFHYTILEHDMNNTSKI